MVVEKRCDNCKNWDSRNGQMGFCEEITTALRLDLKILVHGLSTCSTKADGHCDMFEPSEQALRDAEAEAAHWADMASGAGDYYPASL